MLIIPSISLEYFQKPPLLKLVTLYYRVKKQTCLSLAHICPHVPVKCSSGLFLFTR